MLIECPECKGQASTEANACPHCGFPSPGKSAPVSEPSPGKSLVENPSDAFRLVLFALAKGGTPDVILADLGPGGERFGILTGLISAEMVSRAVRWHQFFLRFLVAQMAGNSVPDPVQLALEHFSGNILEANTALEHLPLWVEAALPKDALQAFMTDGMTLFAEGKASAADIRSKLGGLPEPSRTIALAAWDTPERVELRKEGGAIADFRRNEIAGAQRISEGQGCVGGLASIIGTIFGLLVLYGMIVGLSRSCK